MKAGEWIHTSGRELGGKTAAVLGFGRIGRSVAGMLKKGFGMQVTAFDLFPELDDLFRPLADRYTSDYFDAVRDADYVTLHMNVSDSTKAFINAARIGGMKPGACLVNTARGALVSEDDLYEALAAGTLGGAALDVYTEEPCRPSARERDLRKLPNVVLRSHCGSNTLESNTRMAEACIANVQAWYGRNPVKLALIPEMSRTD
jgi:phosphoglycerate dehydrogenase-like enzyme